VQVQAAGGPEAEHPALHRDPGADRDAESDHGEHRPELPAAAEGGAAGRAVERRDRRADEQGEDHQHQQRDVRGGAELPEEAVGARGRTESGQRLVDIDRERRSHPRRRREGRHVGSEEEHGRSHEDDADLGPEKRRPGPVRRRTGEPTRRRRAPDRPDDHHDRGDDPGEHDRDQGPRDRTGEPVAPPPDRRREQLRTTPRDGAGQSERGEQDRAEKRRTDRDPERGPGGDGGRARDRRRVERGLTEERDDERPGHEETAGERRPPHDDPRRDPAGAAQEYQAEGDDAEERRAQGHDGQREGDASRLPVEGAAESGGGRHEQEGERGAERGCPLDRGRERDDQHERQDRGRAQPGQGGDRRSREVRAGEPRR